MSTDFPCGTRNGAKFSANLKGKTPVSQDAAGQCARSSFMDRQHINRKSVPPIIEPGSMLPHDNKALRERIVCKDTKDVGKSADYSLCSLTTGMC